MTGSDDFYIGYVARTTKTLARVVRRRVVVLFLVASAVALVAASAGGPLGSGTFEYGVIRTFEGTIIESPYPILAVSRADNSGPEVTHYLLVGRGKHGAGPDVAGLDGQTVRLSGTMIRRDGSAMIEVAARPERMNQRAAVGDSVVDLGLVTLTGEIVDAKCHLGVMVPGEGPTHRACAVRCISGGAPALFVARDAAGKSFRLLLVDNQHQPVGRRVLDVVALPLRISGRAYRRAAVLYLAADPSTYERLTGQRSPPGRDPIRFR